MKCNKKVENCEKLPATATQFWWWRRVLEELEKLEVVYC